MKILLSFVLALAVLAPTAQAASRKDVPATVAPAMGIVATVNDDAITSSDLENRMRLMMLGSGIQPSPEILARLRGQVLRSLIDERLQLKEAKDLNITVDEKEIDEQVARLAQQNNLPVSKLPDYFGKGGISIATLREQLRANISWGKVVQRSLRPKVNVGDDEVDAEISRLRANAGKPEYLVADIFLPVDTPSQDAAVEQSAQKLIESMAKGAKFSGIARQFSQSASAAVGGDLGWLTPGQLEPQLDEVLRRMSAGTISPAIRTATGYHILMLREVRATRGGAALAGQPDLTQAVFNLRQVMQPLAANASGATVAQARDKIRAMQAKASSCKDMEQMALELGSRNKGNLGDVKYTALPPAVRDMIAALPDGKPSQIMRNEKGVLFVMVCSRQVPQAAAPAAEPVSSAGFDRDEIAKRIGGQRLDLLVRRYMRDLRQNAFIEVRSQAAQ